MSAPMAMMLLVLILGVVGRSSIIAAAAAIMLFFQVTNLLHYLPFLERRGLEIGLIFLVLVVLIPIAYGRVTWQDFSRSFMTLPGLIAILSGIIATNLNGKGLNMLQQEPYLLIGLVLGSIIGVIFFGGIPVGPLMAGGIAALFLHLVGYLE